MIYDTYNYKVISDSLSVKDAESILVFIEQYYEVKPVAIPYWFSVKMIDKEVLMSEHKHIFVDGKVSKSETIEHNYIVNSHYKRVFYDDRVYISITKHYDKNSESRESEFVENDEYFRCYGNGCFNKKCEGYEYNGNDDLVSIRGTFQGVYGEYKYEYKYDEHQNWIERREYKNDKYISLRIRQFKYK